MVVLVVLLYLVVPVVVVPRSSVRVVPSSINTGIYIYIYILVYLVYHIPVINSSLREPNLTATCFACCVVPTQAVNSLLNPEPDSLTGRKYYTKIFREALLAL